ncbi:Protein kinase-like domain [Cordyceps militaris CM01]|uniref:Protein kinase-like domain n=1 Tax=Cordyceps militaris (strain CM01) TaxID=983644 RepID=G3JE80_CORMM|nr:Protein kinase-like domain [Cordyceps militaris CM01]EGX92905.1 Protein kinase-like domain [Cordyceps militaris CM01]
MADSLPLGSTAWTNGEEYGGGEYTMRINRFIDTVNEKALLSHASLLRGEQPCTLSREFSVGHFNLVRKIQFDDGVEWVVRLRMPPMPEEGSVMASPESIMVEMQSELATMEFVRQNTDIPIPRVYAWDSNAQNAVGCPFSMIEYVHGNTAEEMSQKYPGEHEGIPAQFEEKFWQQMAKFMMQLASIRVPKIGSIIRDGSDSFVVGQLVETGTGPYDSAAEFYADYPLALSKSLGEQPVSGQEELVQAFRSLATSFPSPVTRVGDDSGEGFGLANYDLNPNNVIVDREFNVLAVIDWDSVISVPDAGLYRFPYLMGVSCAVPGVVDAHPAVLKREQLGRRFAEVVEQVAKTQAGKDSEGANKWPKHLFTKSGFFSKEAVAFRSLLDVKMRQDWVNNKWLHGLKWLSEHNDMQVAQFYLQG